MAFEFEIILLEFFESNFICKGGKVRRKNGSMDKEMNKIIRNMETGQRGINGLEPKFRLNISQSLTFSYLTGNASVCLHGLLRGYLYSFMPLWPTGQSSWLLTQRSWVPFPSLPKFVHSNGSGTGFTQPS
jgi:hypothetical protein